VTVLLGALGLAAIAGGSFVLAAGAASAPSRYVPAREGGWHGWLAGPFAGLHIGLPGERFQTLTLILTGGYALALLGARSLPGRAVWATIIAAHLAFALGPPLVSQDVFGYEAFARMGALHGLDPYTHFPSEAPTDPVFRYVGWPFQHSPYGPLFTLASYATAPLGVAGAMWVFKAVAALASVAAVALVGAAAARMGASRRWAIAFVGLNPVLLSLAVAGAHNDTLLLLALSLALLLCARVPARPRAAAVSVAAGIGVKVSAGVLLPFLALAQPRASERARVLVAALAGLAVVALVGVLAFGSSAFGFAGAVGEQQQLIATHSVPAETARLVGLSGTPAWWRDLYLAGFIAVLAVGLWLTARGRADWRTAAGWSTLALLVATAWLLPWYAVWLLPLAALSRQWLLRAATLIFCAYALVFHLPFADGLLSPHTRHVPHHLAFPVPGLVHRVELTGFEVLRDAQLDLRW
jgi:alpha-1,6-mannosyltransferase